MFGILPGLRGVSKHREMHAFLNAPSRWREHPDPELDGQMERKAANHSAG